MGIVLPTHGAPELRLLHDLDVLVAIPVGQGQVDPPHGDDDLVVAAAALAPVGHGRTVASAVGSDRWFGPLVRTVWFRPVESHQTSQPEEPAGTELGEPTGGASGAGDCTAPGVVVGGE